jgi:FtsZ-binding cell division protein ZapB
MRSEGGLDDHLAADLSFEQLEIRVLGEALSTVHLLALDVEHLAADDQ